MREEREKYWGETKVTLMRSGVGYRVRVMPKGAIPGPVDQSFDYRADAVAYAMRLGQRFGLTVDDRSFIPAARGGRG